MANFRLPILVAIGGATGAGLRHGALTQIGSGWWELLILNVIGSLIIGWMLGRYLERNHAVWAGMGIGFCGGLTSFSSFALQVAQRLDGGQWAGGLSLAVTTSVAAVVAAGIGYRLGSG